MTQLTQRALRVFAVLEDYRAGSQDILDAILPFFEPILAEFKGRVLNPEKFADRIRRAYRWNFTADIVEEFIPRFEIRGWVQSVSKTGTEAVYRVTYDNPVATPPGLDEIEIGQVLSAVVKEFCQFIESISPLSAFSRSTEELSDVLVEWLVSIDAYNEEILRHQTIRATQQEGLLSINIDLPDVSELTSEERYLCARFVKHLFEMNSPHIRDLCKIASVGLLTEVIQDFRHPVTQINKTNLIVYLDGPVALDLLGVSGSAAAENIRLLVTKLQDIGGTARIFRVSVDELTQALNAVLKRSPPERTGATADAMRRNETSEAYVRQVAADPDTALSRYKIKIAERRLDQFPNEHEYFTQVNYEDLFARMNWHLELPPREHDSTVVALVQRMRHGNQTRDIFQSRHILVTRNGTLAQLARRFCRDNNLISDTAVSPAVHQRQLATAIWLRTGLTDDEQEIPRRYVLAACERVLELNRNIVEQVRIAARNLTPEKIDQLELLLTQDRSVQVLMDKTLGVSHIISSANIELLVDVMKSSLVVEIEEENAAKVEAIRRTAGANIRKAHLKQRAAENRATDLHDDLLAKEKEDKLAVERLLNDVNRLISRRRLMIHWCVALIVLILGSLPLLSETLAGWAKVATLLISGLLAGALGCFQVLDRPMSIAQKLETWSFRKLKKLAESRSLEEKLARFEVTFINKKLSATPTNQSSIGSSLFQIEKDGSLSRDDPIAPRGGEGTTRSIE